MFRGFGLAFSFSEFAGLAPATIISKTKIHAVLESVQTRHALQVADKEKSISMTAQSLIALIEEMMDLKLQQYAESQMKLTPEVAPLLREKRETDKRRLEQIKSELVRFLES